MHRVKRAGNYANIPDPPAGGTPGYFGPGDLGTNTPATIPGYDWFNAVQEEIIAPILAAGLTLDEADRGQLLAANRLLFGDPDRYALVGKTSGQTINSGVSLKITYQSVIDDPLNMWDAANNRFVVNRGGLYLVQAGASLVTGASAVSGVQIYRNGSVARWGTQHNAGSAGSSMGHVCSSVLRLNANDYVEIYMSLVSAGSATVGTGEAANWFSITYLCG